MNTLGWEAHEAGNVARALCGASANKRECFALVNANHCCVVHVDAAERIVFYLPREVVEHGAEAQS